MSAMFEDYSTRSKMVLFLTRLESGARGAEVLDLDDLFAGLIIEDQKRDSFRSYKTRHDGRADGFAKASAILATGHSNQCAGKNPPVPASLQAHSPVQRSADRSRPSRNIGCSKRFEKGSPKQGGHAPAPLSGDDARVTRRSAGVSGCRNHGRKSPKGDPKRRSGVTVGGFLSRLRTDC